MQRRALLYLAAIFMVTFFWRATTNATSITFPLIAEFYLGFSPSQVMYLAGLTSIGSFISSFFINQRLKRPRTAMISSIFALSALVVALAYSEREELPLVLLAIGLVTGITSPALITSAGSLGEGRERERAIALYSLALSTSLVAGPAVESGALDVTGQNLRLSLALFSAFLLTSGLLSFFIRASGAGEARRARREVLRRREFWRAVAANAIYTFPFVAVVTYGGILASQAFHAPYSISVLLFTAFYGSSFLTRLFITVKPLGAVKRAVIFGSALTFAGLVLVWLHMSLVIFVVGYALLGIPHGLFWPVSLIMIRRSFSDEDLGSANSYYVSMNSALGLVTPFITGLIASFAGIAGTFIAITAPTAAIFAVYLAL